MDPNEHPDPRCACGKPEYMQTGRCEECLAQDGWQLDTVQDEQNLVYYNQCER